MAAPTMPRAFAQAAAAPATAGSPYFDYGTDYGGVGANGKPQDWVNTDATRGVDLPGAEWERYLTANNYGGDSNRDRYVQSQQARAKRGYEAAWQSNPELTFRRYLKQFLGDNVLDGYNQLSASQRGVNPTSRVSTIRWG